MRHLIGGKMVFVMLMEASKFDTHLLSKKNPIFQQVVVVKNNFVTFINFFILI